MKNHAALSVVASSIALTSAAALAQSESKPAAANWPSFRGPDSSGIVAGQLPIEWNVETGKNVLWKTPIPGLAHSSPVIWGDRIFVTTAVREDAESKLSSLYGSPGYGAGESVVDEGVHAFRIYCLDKQSGDVLWFRDAAVGVPKAKRHPKSSHANPTPTCDAQRVVVSFGSEGLFCYDHDGNFIWKRDFGVLNSGAPGNNDKDSYQWGFASSPILFDGRVIVQCDVENQSFLTVLDARDGSDIWRVDRDEDSTWGSPAVVRGAQGGAQIVVNGYKHIGGYNLASGEEIWNLVGGGDVPVPTPLVSGDLIYITSAHGRMRPIYAIRTTARGLVTIDPAESEHMAWSYPRKGIYMQTPIVVDGLLYCCSDGGVLSCYDAKTGEEFYRKRLGSGGAGFSGSAIAATGQDGAGYLYFTSESGEVHVVRQGKDFEVVAVNDMGATCMSTPAASDGRMYFRTRDHLIAVGER